MKRFQKKQSALIGAALMVGAVATAWMPAAVAAGTGQPGGTSVSTSPTGAATPAAKLSAADRQFAMKAAQGGMAEVELGKLAQSKAQSDQVKSFASRIVDDHTSANDKLKQVAGAEGLQLPTEMDKASQKMHDKLSKLSGAQFDQAYMTHMVADHQKDIKEFQKESTSGKDSALKKFAADTLPTLREHLTLAQQAKSAAMSEARSGKSARSASSDATAPQAALTPHK